jgi:hydroxyacyl-ACP dehydratase HTD2-like protein with hotdog domain
MESKKPKLIEIRPAEGRDPISIEITPVEGEGGIVQAGPLSFDEMIKKINPFCEAIIRTFQTLNVKPKAASAEFGLKLSMDGNLFIVKASGEATLKVTLNWSME